APGQRIAETQTLNQQELHQLLVEWNDTQRELRLDQCLHQLFETQVGRTPEAVALVTEQGQMSYFELNGRANRLADHLIQLGVRPETCVGVLVDRTAEMVIALLGVLKSGAAYLPLDGRDPQGRLLFMMAEAGVSVLVTQQRLSDVVPNREQVTVLSVEEDWKSAAQFSSANPEAEVNRENLAYVLYTSGSTGQPKGV